MSCIKGCITYTYATQFGIPKPADNLSMWEKSRVAAEVWSWVGPDVMMDDWRDMSHSNLVTYMIVYGPEIACESVERETM